MFYFLNIFVKISNDAIINIGEISMSDFMLDDFLERAVAIGASDVHLHVGEHPVVRRNGSIIKIDIPFLSIGDIDAVLEEILPRTLDLDKLRSIYDVDFAYELQGVARFRVNVSRQLDTLAIVFRVIPYHVRTVAELNLPEIVNQFVNLNNGLVLITGPTGAGKSTTIASMIDYINKHYSKHIITIEDPIEFIFTSRRSIISQRQIKVDTDTFTNGIKYALRQDPDVILIGEIRDTDTLTNALKAAETGHLVFATIHTNSAVHTVNRIIDMYNPVDRPFIRSQVADLLRGTISQKLIPLKDGSGRRPACEILNCTATVQDLIRKDELESIYDLVRKGSFADMVTLNDSIFDLLQKGLITEEEALTNSNNEQELRQMMRGVYHGSGLDR